MPSDVFPALFGALRSRLTAQVSLSDSSTTPVHPRPLAAPSRVVFSCASDALLASLSASDPSVNQSILQEIRADACSNKLQVLRHKRLGMKKTREAKRRQLQRVDALAAAECDAALQEVTAHDQKLQFFITETHSKAKARLKTLFFECIAEMKKALIRMEGLAADTTEESESMVEEAIRRNDWQFFLTRLQQDCGGNVEASLLVPVPLCDTSSAGSLHRSGQASEVSVKAILQKVLEEHGPAMENGGTLVLASADTLQFPGTACDIPLSSAHIGWMLPRRTNSQDTGSATDRTGGRGYEELADSNIYFDIAEYEQNFAAVMQNYATSAAMDDTSMSSSVGHAVLASARRSLREMSAILERSREQKEAYCADTVFASRQMRDDANDAMISKVVDGRHAIFARASVLQLVQTLYYSKCFLELLPPADVDILRKLYPTSLFGEGCLSTLYVPVVSTPVEQKVQQQEDNTASSKACMVPLEDNIIHELLLLHVARGRNVLTHSQSSTGISNQQLTSLALSDAVNTLVPHGQADSNQRTGDRFCVIRNPQGLCDHDKETRDASISKEFQCFRDADVVVVECSVSPQLGISSTRQPIVSQDTNTNAVLEMLGASCMWRSCITSRDYHEQPNDSSLCHWHTSVQRFLEVDESMQYVPNENRMREAFLAAERDSLPERKRVIQTSSSLLEELSSSHLPHSINAFYEHVISAASNRAYQTDFLETAMLDEISSEITTSMSAIEQSHHELQRVVDVAEAILCTEHCVTKELRQLFQLTVYPGVEDSFIQHGFYDLEELQTDIRTRDLDLLLCLSQQKLQILERRRKDEEKQVARRLAPSTSLPSISFHSALEKAGPELGSASVYDVIHVMRKGRRSLLREQRQQTQGGGVRNGSKRNVQPSLERSASDLAYRVNPYEAKVAPITKYRASGASNGRKTSRKNSNR
ncbi:hypothetical protein KRP22_005334 [Phytophthora ramorum]|nr:hypothetical protein KRP22_3535 [Phytophthora ramorum]